MILPVFQTPFHEDESVDFRMLERELSWLLDEQADGVVMAMVSETLRLATDERDTVCEFVCQAISRRGVAAIGAAAESSYIAGLRGLNHMLEGTKLPRLDADQIEALIHRDSLRFLA